MVDPDMQSLVLDCGSGFCRAGFSGDDSPRSVFMSVCGRTKHIGIMLEKDCYVGEEARAKRGIMKLKRPVENGLITNWNDIEKIWDHIFHTELKVSPDEHPVLLAETPLNPRNNREKMTSIMFETFNVPAMYVAMNAVLALYTSGRRTGLVLDSGYGVTHTVPIFGGYAIHHSIHRLNLAGRDVTEYLIKLLGERGFEMTTSSEIESAQNIKEELCYVCEDYKSELEKLENSANCGIYEYELPDSSKIKIGDERFRVPEMMFSPSSPSLFLEDSELKGIHEMIFESVVKSEVDLRNILLENIVLAGGNMRFEGIGERIRKEVCRLNFQSDVKVKVNVPVYKNAVWIGGSILSSLSTFHSEWITKEEYDDAGATIVHRKCF